MVNYRDYIVMDPSIRFGKSIIKGTRVSVYEVLNWLANDMSINDILNDYPELKVESIKACLLYAADKEHKIRVAS